MRHLEIDRSEAEDPGVGALAAAVAELCDVARAGLEDALDRCDLIMRRFEDGAADRRHRVSSMSALQLAIRNRMPGGAIKAHIDAHLADRLSKLKREGRFDSSANTRHAFN